MTGHLRDRLHDEMSNYPLPPEDGMVARAVASGLRTRRIRRAASGLGTVAIVGLTVLTVTVGSQIGAGPASTSVTGQAGSVVAAQPVTKVALKSLVTPKAVTATAAVTTTEAAPSAGTKDAKVAAAQEWHARQTAASALAPPQWTAAPTGVPATPKGELQLFTDLAKPYGTTSHFAVSEDADKTHVSAYLTDADGKTGMIQFSLLHDTLGQAGDCVKPAPNDISCHPTSDGGYIIEADDNAGCVNTADITVVHPDGTAVWITLASCLTDATNNVIPGSQTLSSAEAEKIFQDPGFDFTMPADVVARGEQTIGDLATFH